MEEQNSSFFSVDFVRFIKNRKMKGKQKEHTHTQYLYIYIHDYIDTDTIIYSFLINGISAQHIKLLCLRFLNEGLFK